MIMKRISESLNSSPTESSCVNNEELKEIRKKMRTRLNYIESHAETMIERLKDTKAQCDQDHTKIMEFLKKIDSKFSSLDVKMNERLDKMQTESNQKMKEKLDQMREMYEVKLDNLETKMNEKFETLESSMDAKFKSYTDKIINKLNSESKKPCCRYCWEEFDYLSTIRQCLNGHLVCQQCHVRDGTGICGLCKEPRTGRAFGLELHLLDIADIN